MIAKDKQDIYAQNYTDYDKLEASGCKPQLFSTEVLPTFSNHVYAWYELCDSNVYHELQVDLVKHIWENLKCFMTKDFKFLWVI